MNNIEVTIAQHELPLNWDITETQKVVVSLSYPIPAKYGFRDLKKAVVSINDAIENEIKIDFIRRDWDCTGQYFTCGIDIINKTAIGGYLVYTLIHSIGIDI